MVPPAPFQTPPSETPQSGSARPTPTTPDRGDGPVRLSVRIPDMDCATEEAEIRQVLERVEGIEALRFATARRMLSLQVRTPGQFDAALAAIRRLGYAAHPVDETAASASALPAAGCGDGCAGAGTSTARRR